ncbi:MAG: UDP binding domain-containing protein, partial [Bacteroidota bacterium]
MKKILESGKNSLESRVLVLGATFKENVSDIRNSKVVDVIRELESFSVQVDVMDPHADSDEVMHEYGFHLNNQPAEGQYDAIVVTVAHREFMAFTEADFRKYLRNDKGVIMDIKG